MTALEDWFDRADALLAEIAGGADSDTAPPASDEDDEDGLGSPCPVPSP